MPKGPIGEKRPADVIGNAVLVAKIATGDANWTRIHKSPRVSPAMAAGFADRLYDMEYIVKLTDQFETKKVARHRRMMAKFKD
jgi:hypothetical protein